MRKLKALPMEVREKIALSRGPRGAQKVLFFLGEKVLGKFTDAVQTRSLRVERK